MVKFREIFEQTRLEHNSATESKVWSGGPNMKYWPQQLNFAVFCATQGCGISREIFDSGVELPEQIRAFYKFHVYFTVRRILFQMGGIQSVSALPGDPTFNRSGNNYDVASYKRICGEFGIAQTSDFRFTGGKNHGLRNVYIGVTGHGPMKTGTAWQGGYYKFSDEGGRATDGNLLYFIKPDDVPQYDWFAPNKTAGLYPGRAGERKKQHNRRKRKSKRGADRVFDPDGKRDNSARPGEKRAKIPARGRRSESQAQPGRGPHGVADAGEHDHKHGKRGRLQQQAQTGDLRGKAGHKQQPKHRQKNRR